MLTAELVSIVVGAVLSIVLEVVPGLAEWWGKWEYKRAVWLGGCLAAAFGMVGLCYAGAPVGFECAGPFIWEGLWAAGRAAFAAYFGGQLTYAAASRRWAKRKRKKKE